MDSTQSPLPEGASQIELPPELARFWTAFATSQIRKGRRDIGAMVQAALEYLFERGTQRLKPMMRSQEDFEAFRNALKEEFARIDKALANHSGDAPSETLAEPYGPKQFRIVRREDDSKPATDAVQVSPWPRTVAQRAEVESYRTALEKQFNATLQAIDDNTKRLMEARQQLQAQLVPYSPTFYNMASRLLTEFDASMRPATAGLVKAGDEAGLVPTNAGPVGHDMKAVIQRMGAELLTRFKTGLTATPSAHAAPPAGQEQFEKWLAALNGEAAPAAGLVPVAPSPSPLQRFIAWVQALLQKRRG